MRRSGHVVVAAAVIAAIAVLPACRRDAKRAEATDAPGRAASQAMAALNEANDELAIWFPASAKELTRLILADPPAGSRHLDIELLPRLDAYLALADDAVEKAVAYQAQLQDPSVQTSIDTIRRRTAAIHQLRVTLAGIRDDLARPGLTADDLERIATTLSTAGAQLFTAN